jgi:hypothetical protein
MPKNLVYKLLSRNGQIPESVIGGVDFRLPDGSPPPSPSFSFKRVRKQSGSKQSEALFAGRRSLIPAANF